MAILTRGGTATLPLDVLLGLTVLGIAPFVLVMTTSFVRIVVVLSIVRSAIGAASLPPNAVLTGLALVLTFITMTPTLQAVSKQAIDPYTHGKIAQAELVRRAAEPLRSFMLRQSRSSDIALFERAARIAVGPPREAPIAVVISGFVVGELRSAFAIGFALYLPFVAIDLAVASILMGLGMFMLSPPVVSLPCKLLLFVMVDGWALVCGNLVTSFR